MDYIPNFLKPKSENSPLLYSVYLKDSMPSEMGNLNLYKRPQVQNKDGSVSTVKSISIGIGDSKSPNKTALIPLIHPDGYEMKNDEAIKWYKKTGQHLGVFDSESSASSYAQALHEQQATIYRKK